MKIFAIAALLTIAATAGHAAGHSAASSFQNTCSNITFFYAESGDAMIGATCLRADGSPNKTSIAMPPIGNNDGTLEMGGDSATFQHSCGSIHLMTAIDGVTLAAACRTTNGDFNDTTIAVPGIGNNDGTLGN